jgi:uncharacterized protein (TIGR00297 family)
VTLTHLLVSFLAAGVVAIIAWRVRSLDRSGALAATVLGGAITASTGWEGGAILIAFFVSSSLLSRTTSRLRPEQGRNVKRGSRRDAKQVLANGGVALVCAMAWSVWETDWLLGAFAASLATAAADTWATEIGAFSKSRPRLITTLKPVARGVSGAMSLLGTAATVAGAAFIAIAAVMLLGELNAGSLQVFFAISAAGVIGSLADSVLGATIQIHYHCPTCDELTERTIHRCGTPATYARGSALFTNDTVNLTAIVVGALTGALLLA